MAIVWPTRLDVDGYVAAGREVEVPRPACPCCGEVMQFWGWYERDLRVSAEVIHRLAVRRARCGDCRRSDAMLPGFVTSARLDAVEVIGVAVEAMCGGVGMRRAADDLNGHLVIKMDAGDVALAAGQLYVVTRGVPHQPVSAKRAEILLIEPRATVNTGDTPGTLTAERRVI